jgi:hypothetical protein
MSEEYGRYDPAPDLGTLLGAVLDRDMTSAGYRAARLADHLGIGTGDSGEAIAGKLREALGLNAPKCRCVTGGGDLIPLACPVHGIACPSCGGLEECAEGCTGEACEVVRSLSRAGCSNSPAGLYGAECDLGHKREGWLCARHAVPGVLWCRECFEADGTVRYVTPVPVPEAVARLTMPGQVTP